MAKILLSCIQDCFYGTGEWDPSKGVPVAPSVPDVTLDSSAMGHEAVIVKNAARLCGTGAARATTAIQQNKAYWEVKLQQSGIWSCGVRNAVPFGEFCLTIFISLIQVCNSNSDLNSAQGKDGDSWVLGSDNIIRTKGEEEYKISQQISEGDILVIG
jgi:hypothetical protein